MTIQPIKLPVIVEQPQSFSPSSQNARIEGSWRNSDLAQTHIYAQRLQAQMRAAEVPTVSLHDKVKTFTYRLALGCGTLAFPAIACAFFVKNGWMIPAGLAVSCLVLFLIAGKRTAEIKQQGAEMAARAQDPCPV
jgi:hypothetical protein